MIRFAISIFITFGLSWIPLAGSFHYETALTIALAGIILLPICCGIKTQKTNEETHKNQKTLPQTIARAAAFWTAATATAALTACIKGEIFCDFWQGLTFQLLIALPANILTALTWGWTQKIAKSHILQISLYILCIAADFGFTLFALYTWPPLVAFGQFFGFFAGSIYDEAIHITNTLIAYRCGTLVLCICLALAQTQNPKHYHQYLLPCLGLACACATHAWLAYTGQITPFGHQKLQNTLWQTVSAPDQAFHIHFIPNSRNQKILHTQKQQLLHDYWRDYTALEQFFGNRPPAPEGIHIWLYPDKNLKAQFIGAKNTSFARVWLNEIHLVQTSPDSTLAKHEMAHLFAAQFGNGPLKVAGGWNIPALGWIEGLAMAAEWPIIQNFDLHKWSAAILENPQTFGTITPHQLIYGFWGMPSRVAYTLAGSYVAYLIVHYGIERIKLLSQSMPGDFEDIIGVNFHEAFNNWKLWLKTYHTHPQTLHTAEIVFGTTSIWNKQCARTQAAQKADFYQCLNSMTCPELQEIQIHSCTQDKITTFPQWPNTKSHSHLSLDEIWALHLALGPLERVRLPRALIIISQNPHFTPLTPAFKQAFKAYGIQESPLSTQNCAPQSLILTQNAPLSDTLRLHIAQNLITQAPDWSKSLQYHWLERLADMMWHSDQYALSGMIYGILKGQYLPETTARRIDIKHQAVQYPKSPASHAVRRWFVAHSKEEQTILARQYDQIPVIAYLEFVNAFHRNEKEQAKDAVMRMLMFSQNTDPATRLSTKTWAETFRLMPFCSTK